MRAVVQRVAQAQVTVDDDRIAAIGRGLLILLGVAAGDGPADLDWLAGKVAGLRIWPDATGRMALDLAAIDGSALVVSQFTLLASTRRGRRPDFLAAAPPTEAETLYEAFADRLASLLARPIPRGRFGAHMQVTLTNDGPVTLLLDTHLRE